MSLFLVKSISKHSLTGVAATRRSLSSAATLDLSDQTARCIELEERYGAHNYHPLPVVLASGKGMCIRTVKYVYIALGLYLEFTRICP